MERKISHQVRGQEEKDGAGVKLVRVLGKQTVQEYDPILMLDCCDSKNPDDYTAGFPMHPHRGIETISYVYRGQMTHRDSLGNEDTIADGGVQWMTAGSGILHEEKLPVSERLLWVQLWLNLPAKDKMAPPAYHSIKNREIEEIELENGKLRLLAGEFKGRQGYLSKYLPLDYYDIHLNPNASIVLDTDSERSVMLFTLLGEAYVGDELIKEKTAVKLTSGDHVEIKATDKNAQVLFISSTRLDEPVVWGGPIVMNTKEEMNKAFDDYKKGTFLQSKILYSGYQTHNGVHNLRRLHILAIVGSLRKDSYNLQLALAARELLRKKVDFTLLKYRDIPFMNQDIEYPAPTAVKHVRDEVKSADGIWFFTPEYNHFFPGVLKNLIDWLSRPISEKEPQVLAGKPAAISGISPGMSGTGLAQDHLVTLISFLNMDVMNVPRLTIPNAAQQVDNQGKLTLETSYPYLEKQADAFIDFVQRRILNK